MLPFAQLNFFLHFSRGIHISLINRILPHLSKLIHLRFLHFDSLFCGLFLPFKQFNSILKHLDFIFCLFSHLSLLQHLNSFFNQIGSVLVIAGVCGCTRGGRSATVLVILEVMIAGENT